MGLQATIQSAVQNGLTALDDLLQDVTYKYKGNDTYDPVTGGVVANEGTTLSVKLIEVKQRTDLLALNTDVEFYDFIIETRFFSTFPKVGDLIAYKGDDYFIESFINDPSFSIYTFTAYKLK